MKAAVVYAQREGRNACLSEHGLGHGGGSAEYVRVPAVTIPVHHDLPGRKFPRLADARAFTRRFPPSRVVWAQKPEVELSRETLPTEPEVWVLQATSAGRPGPGSTPVAMPRSYAKPFL